MDFSNRHTNEFVYTCNLERVLGGDFVCHAGIAGAEEYCVNVDYKGITKRFSPRPKLGEGRVRVHSDINSYCHSVPDTESEICACANTNANSPRHICESKLGRGDFLVQVGEYLKKSVRAQIEVNPQPSYAHLLPSLGEGKTSHADTKGITNLVGWGFHPNNDGGVK